MKRILALFFLLVSAGVSSAQLNVWRWQNPLPEGDVLHAVQMVSLNVTYACGENGSFLRTSDGGVTWDVLSNVLKLKTVFNSLSFLDQNYGMICGDSGHVLKTTDGGSSWKLLDTNSHAKLNSIIVLDKQIAIMVTMGGGIIKTTDGGNTWFTIPIEGNYALYSISKLRTDFLTITGYGGTLMNSFDTGKTWTTLPMRNYGNTFFSARFSDDTTATIIGDFGLILHTTDGGASWVKQQLKDNFIITASLNVVDGRDPNVFAIAGDYGTLLYTSDGGTTWLQSDIGTADDVKGLSFFDKLTATAVGKNGIILRTTDGGVSWKYQPSKHITDVMRSISFPKGDTSHGIAVGDNGSILRTSDGGKVWTPIESGFTHMLRSVCFMDSISAIAVGEYGRILKTTDAGLTWNTQLSSTAKHLYSVSFATPTDGLVVGDSGTVLRTYSAGEFWTREFAPFDFYCCVSYPDVQHAFLLGFYNSYISVDGGVNWKPRQLNGGFSLSVSFADSLHGADAFVVEVDTLWKGLRSVRMDSYVNFTSDGGVTWYGRRLLYSTNSLGSTSAYVQCVDPLHSTVVGGHGYIGHTTDAGITWNVQQSNTPNNLYAVCFGTLQAGTTVGNHGNILRITTAEINSSVREQGARGSPKIIFDGNYPNPFSGYTRISYRLPESGITTIEIFSIDGKRMAQLANEYEYSGDHSIRFDAERLASETYLCQISCNGMSVVGKLKIEN